MIELDQAAAWEPYSSQILALNFPARVRFGQIIELMRRRLVIGRQVNAPVKNTPFVFIYPPYTGTAADTWFNSPRILVPANKNRIGLVIGQTSLDTYTHPSWLAFYSFGYPAMTAPAGPGKSYGLVIPGWCLTAGAINVQHLGPLGNGTISEDAVWITVTEFSTLGPPTNTPGYIVAYEQSLAIESERTREAA